MQLDFHKAFDNNNFKKKLIYIIDIFKRFLDAVSLLSLKKKFCPFHKSLQIHNSQIVISIILNLRVLF